MSAFMLKLLALFCMAIDHTGAVLFPQQEVLRWIGRLAFPIYCFLLSEGFFFTSSRKRYLLRLLLFGILSEPCFDFAFSGLWWRPESQNVFWTLALGLASIWAIEKFREIPFPGILLAFCCALLAEVLHTDYGAFGVFLVLIFAVFHSRRLTALGVFALADIGYALNGSIIQIGAVLAAVPIWLYNKKRGPRLPKLLFYGFYPAHLLVLGWLRLLLR